MRPLEGAESCFRLLCSGGPSRGPKRLEGPNRPSEAISPLPWPERGPDRDGRFFTHAPHLMPHLARCRALGSAPDSSFGDVHASLGGVRPMPGCGATPETGQPLADATDALACVLAVGSASTPSRDDRPQPLSSDARTPRTPPVALTVTTASVPDGSGVRTSNRRRAGAAWPIPACVPPSGSRRTGLGGTGRDQGPRSPSLSSSLV